MAVETPATRATSLIVTATLILSTVAPFVGMQTLPITFPMCVLNVTVRVNIVNESQRNGIM
ncbi:hypothetical protein GCM10023170_069050 [Phytohabitans houttuyneae]|uniref:Uncharacterized protein n=1 Tax=Phytohabitans houttuyneae TaxID=1076126 RepID=A0A6V8K7C7_9ACTN|nr:hypothetical protein Phou_052930 [Phytohabitans houttuyneae]